MLSKVTGWKANVTKAARSKAKVAKVEPGVFLMVFSANLSIHPDSEKDSARGQD